MSALVPALPLALALVAGALLSVLGRVALPARRAVAGTALAANVLLALWLVVLADRGATFAFGLDGRLATVTLGLVLDRLAAWMLLITATVALLGFAYACGVGADRARGRFHAFVQFQLLGLQGCLLAADLIDLFLFAEVAVIASYALAQQRDGESCSGADLPDVALQLAGSTLFVAGIVCVHTALGAIGYADIALGAPASAALVRVLSAGGVLLLAALGLKAALLPFAAWDAQEQAPAVPLVLLAVTGVYALLRIDTLVLPCIGDGPCGPLPAVLPLGLGVLAGGALGVLAAVGLRPLAARLLLVPLGWLLIAVGSGRGSGFAAAVYGLAHAALAGAAICLASDLVARTDGAHGGRFDGARAPASPALALLYAGAAAGIVGLPPLSGFIARLAVLNAAAADALVVWSVVLIASLALLVVAVRAAGAIGWTASPSLAAPAPRAAALAVAAAVALQGALALAAGPAFRFADRTARQLVDRAAYVAATRAQRT